MAADPWVVQNSHGPEVGSILSVMYDYATDSSGPGYVDMKYNATFEQLYLGAFDRTASGAALREEATSEQIGALVGWLYGYQPQEMVQILALDDEHGYATLVTIKTVNSMDSATVQQLYGDLKADVIPLTDMGVFAVITGDMILTEVIMSSISESQMISLIITLLASLLILTAIMWYTRRSFVLGPLAVLPIAFCVVWTWGSMFLLGISLNVMTLTIASLTIGMGITYGIHITHRFVEDLNRYGDVERAVKNAVGKTGTSLLGAALTTIVGFGIIGFSILPPVQQFGMLTALAISFSFISATLILPSLLVIWARRKAGLKANGDKHPEQF
jgi:predicted RND superfamily exporter protein